MASFGSNDCWKHDKTVSYGFLCVKIIFAFGNNKFIRGKQTVWNGNLSIIIFIHKTKILKLFMSND